MCKRLMSGLASLSAVALSVTPALAQATPRWFINDRPAEAKHEGVVSYGTLTLENDVLGKINCQTITAASVWNQSERGEGQTEGFTTYGCRTEPSPCPGAFITAEKPVEVKFKQFPKEKEPEAVRVGGYLPWAEETIREEAGERQRKVRIHDILITVVLPCMNLEVQFEGNNIEPISENGIGDGLSPSHRVFQGKGGKTGFLTHYQARYLGRRANRLPHRRTGGRRRERRTNHCRIGHERSRRALNGSCKCSRWAEAHLRVPVSGGLPRAWNTTAAP
jgi:hypothetical protein